MQNSPSILTLGAGHYLFASPVTYYAPKWREEKLKMHAQAHVADARVGIYVKILTIFSILLATFLHSPSVNAETRENDVLDNGGTVSGGFVQHSDPTRYDYVPERSPIVPLGAQGYAWIPAFEYTFGGATIPVPGGQIFHRIDGSGLHIAEESATYTAPANICNYRFDFQNRDNGGRIISTRSTGVHNGCQFGMVGHVPLQNFNVQSGMMCARLFVSGAFRGEQCHHIYA